MTLRYGLEGLPYFQREFLKPSRFQRFLPPSALKAVERMERVWKATSTATIYYQDDEGDGSAQRRKKDSFLRQNFIHYFFLFFCDLVSGFEVDDLDLLCSFEVRTID